MPEPLTAIAVAALVLAAVSLLLARIVPDRYDDLRLSRVPVRKR